MGLNLEPMLEVSDPLPSWVRNLSFEDAELALDAAFAGMDRDAFFADADVWLPQPEPDYRATLMRLVWDWLIDKDEDGLVVKSRYLHLFVKGKERRRRDLYFARYGLAHEWTLVAAREVLAPARVVMSEPDAPKDAGRIPTAAWNEFIGQHLDPAKPASSRNKTRSTVVGVLVNLGGLEHKRTYSVPVWGQPDPLAFCWAVAWELGARGLGEISETEAATTSAAAYLYGVSEETGLACLAKGVEAGFFERIEEDGEVVLLLTDDAL